MIFKSLSPLTLCDLIFLSALFHWTSRNNSSYKTNRRKNIRFTISDQNTYMFLQIGWAKKYNYKCQKCDIHYILQFFKITYVMSIASFGDWRCSVLFLLGGGNICFKKIHGFIRMFTFLCSQNTWWNTGVSTI